MKLTLILPELEAGFSIQQGTKDRMTELGHLVARREPLAICPVMNHDHRQIAVILPIADAVRRGETRLEIKFRPVWCRTFTRCASRKDTLLSLVVETDFGKYWIDHEGHRVANVTTNGNGCDPKVVEQAEVVLGTMLADVRRNDILRSAISFIQRSF